MERWIPREGLRGWTHARSARPQHAQRRRALVLAAACGLLIALVAASVFSLGQRSRDVAAQANELHAVDEGLRAATLARSQLLMAHVLMNVDRTYATDSTTAIKASLVDARGALAALDATWSVTQDPTATERRFRTAAGAAFDTLQDGKPSAARMERLASSFDAARKEMTDRRTVVIERLASMDERTSSLGALATFVVAFLLPLCVVGIYMALTRHSKTDLHRAITSTRLTADRSRRGLVTRAALADVRAAIVRPDAHPDDAVRRLDALGRLLAVLDDDIGQRFATVPLEPVVDQAASAYTQGGLAVRVDRADLDALTDPRALRELLASLLDDACDRGACTAEIAMVHGAQGPELWVSHDGTPADDALRRVVHAGQWDDAAVGARITAALLVGEALGVTMEIGPAPRAATVVRIPGRPAAPARARAA